MKTKSNYLKVLKVKTLVLIFLVVLITIFLYLFNEPINAESIVSANGESEVIPHKQNMLSKNTLEKSNDMVESSIDTILISEYDDNSFLDCYCTYCTSKRLKPCTHFVGCFDSLNTNKLFFLKLSAERLQ